MQIAFLLSLPSTRRLKASTSRGKNFLICFSLFPKPKKKLFDVVRCCRESDIIIKLNDTHESVSHRWSLTVRKKSWQDFLCCSFEMEETLFFCFRWGCSNLSVESERRDEGEGRGKHTKIQHILRVTEFLDRNHFNVHFVLCCREAEMERAAELKRGGD
jgi:hypothetical protein